MKINYKTSLMAIILINGFSIKSAAPYVAEVATSPGTNVEMSMKIPESSATNSSAEYVT